MIRQGKGGGNHGDQASWLSTNKCVDATRADQKLTGLAQISVQVKEECFTLPVT